MTSFQHMSVKEKLELFEAIFEGKEIEWYSKALCKWVIEDRFTPDGGSYFMHKSKAYRVKPEEERSIMALYREGNEPGKPLFFKNVIVTMCGDDIVKVEKLK